MMWCPAYFFRFEMFHPQEAIPRRFRPAGIAKNRALDCDREVFQIVPRNKKQQVTVISKTFILLR